MTPVDRAIDAAGSVSNLAAMIGIRQQAVSNWRSRGSKIPAEYCPVIERELGIRCEELRPDVAWEVLRCRCDEE